MSQETKKVKIIATELLEKVLKCTDDEKTQRDIVNVFESVGIKEEISFTNEITEKFKEACITLKTYMEGDRDMDLNKLKELCTIFGGYVALAKPDFCDRDMHLMYKLIPLHYHKGVLLSFLRGAKKVPGWGLIEHSQEIQLRLGKEVYEFIERDSAFMRQVIVYMGFYQNKEALCKLVCSLEFNSRDATRLNQMQLKKLIVDIWRNGATF